MNRELYLSSLADNGSFALEYYLIGEYKENLLKDGIKYCGLLISAQFQLSPIKENDFGSTETIQSYYNQEKLLKYVDIAYEIYDNLFNILQKNKINLSEEKIRSYQHFFNETSGIFLGGAMKKLRRGKVPTW